MKGKVVSKEQSGQVDRKATRVDGQRLHQLIREDIVEGRLEPEARLVVAELAKRYGTSSNPVREALHQLQGKESW